MEYNWPLSGPLNQTDTVEEDSAQHFTQTPLIALDPNPPLVWCQCPRWDTSGGQGQEANRFWGACSAGWDISQRSGLGLQEDLFHPAWNSSCSTHGCSWQLPPMGDHHSAVMTPNTILQHEDGANVPEAWEHQAHVHSQPWKKLELSSGKI